MRLIQYEPKHLDAIMVDLKPALRSRIAAAKGFSEAIENAPYAITLAGDGPLGAAWFLPLNHRQTVAVALSTNALRAGRDFLPLCRSALGMARAEVGFEELYAHVHESFPASGAWLEKLGFKAVGLIDGLLEYRYEATT